MIFCTNPNQIHISRKRGCNIKLLIPVTNLILSANHTLCDTYTYSTLKHIKEKHRTGSTLQQSGSNKNFIDEINRIRVWQ